MESKNTTEYFEGAVSSAEASSSHSVCMRVPLILRKILEHISNLELIEFSLVNKQWNYEARCVLRDRGTLIASLKSCNPCRNLQAFVSDLRRMNVVPFSGIRLHLITNRHADECQESWQLPPTEEMDFIHNSFDRLQCKFFHIIINDCYRHLDDDSLAFVFIQKVLKDFGAVLEEFTITPQSRLEDSVEEILQDCISFPNLQKFTFNGTFDDVDDEDNYNLVKSVVSIAPNLQEVHVGWTDALETLLEGSSAVVVPYHDIDPLHLESSQSLIAKLRLQSVQLDDIENCSVERFNRIIPLVLNASSSALTKLTTNPISALPLMTYGICFENLTKLQIDVGLRPSKLLRPHVAELLQAFDFTRIFPKLKQVSIVNNHREVTPDQIRDFVSQGEAVLQKPTLSDRAAKIKDLSLHETSLLQDDFATFFAELFPSIDRLSVAVSEELEESCGQIWKHWMDLKELEIKFQCQLDDQLANLDSLFCGILPEEVNELRKMDDEYLKCVNIVPVMPSFISLKSLRKFVFALEVDRYLRVGRKPNPTFIFSRVTGWIAFARCPALSVTIEHDGLASSRALSHMEPFASIRTIDFKKRFKELQLH